MDYDSYAHEELYFYCYLHADWSGRCSASLVPRTGGLIGSKLMARTQHWQVARRIKYILRLKGIYPEFQVIRGFSQKILADLLSYDQIHS